MDHGAPSMDLNLRPAAYKADALPTELWGRWCVAKDSNPEPVRIPSGLHSFTTLCRVGLQPRARLDGARCCVYIAARANADPKAHCWDPRDLAAFRLRPSIAVRLIPVHARSIAVYVFGTGLYGRVATFGSCAISQATPLPTCRKQYIYLLRACLLRQGVLHRSKSTDSL